MAGPEDAKKFVEESRLKGLSDDAIRTILMNFGLSRAEVEAVVPGAPAAPAKNDSPAAEPAGDAPANRQNQAGIPDQNRPAPPPLPPEGLPAPDAAGGAEQPQ